MHEGTYGLVHEASHVDLHLLRTEGIVNIGGAFFKLSVGVNGHYFVLHAHQLGDASIHPIFDHVDLDLEVRNKQGAKVSVKKRGFGEVAPC